MADSAATSLTLEERIGKNFENKFEKFIVQIPLKVFFLRARMCMHSLNALVLLILFYPLFPYRIVGFSNSAFKKKYYISPIQSQRDGPDVSNKTDESKDNDDSDSESPSRKRSVDQMSRARSEDELSSAAGDGQFSRDGLGRQSISEKRHGTIDAKTTKQYWYEGPN